MDLNTLQRAKELEEEISKFSVLANKVYNYYGGAFDEIWQTFRLNCEGSEDKEVRDIIYNTFRKLAEKKQKELEAL